MFGFLPPNSKDIFLKRGAARPAMRAPVTVPPVKLMTGVRGSVINGSPARRPVPCTRFTTPGGTPASPHNFPKRYAVKGVSSLGLATTVFPAAKAGAIFQVNRYSGKFHGEMQATTPMGCRNVMFKCPPLIGWDSELNVRIDAAKNRKLSTARGISVRLAKLIGLP